MKAPNKQELFVLVVELTDRERRIFEARRLTEDPPTLEQLAQEMSISSERVRQIETRAFAKVRRAARHYLRA